MMELLPIDDAKAIEMAVEWIKASIEPCNNEGAYSSYGLKHCFEYDSRYYITNDDFKRAMLEAGYKPTKRSMKWMNWCFRYRPKKGKTLVL